MSTKKEYKPKDQLVSQELFNAWGFGAGGRTRTDMSLTSPDFESGAYTNFATPAGSIEGKDNKSNA